MDWRWTPGGPGYQEQAAQGMAGYRPAQGYVQQMQSGPSYDVTAYGRSLQQMQRGPSYDVNEYGRGLQQASLRAEYESNNDRIAEIEARLATMDREWDAGEYKRGRDAMNDLDLRLARSSAKHGNLDRAYNHLSRIDTRNTAAANKDVNAITQKDADRKELRNAYIMMAEASPAAQASWEGAIADMEAAYERKYGEKFEGLAIPTGDVENASGVKSWDQFDNLLQQKKNSKGNLSQASIDEMKLLLQKMPLGKEYNLRKEQLDSMKSQEQIDANAKAQRKKESTAIDEAMGAITGFNMEPGESKTYTAKNGLSVTCQKKGSGMQYTCGKTTRTR